jgi:hypothetical protein
MKASLVDPTVVLGLTAGSAVLVGRSRPVSAEYGIQSFDRDT